MFSADAGLGPRTDPWLLPPLLSVSQVPVCGQSVPGAHIRMWPQGPPTDTTHLNLLARPGRICFCVFIDANSSLQNSSFHRRNICLFPYPINSKTFISKMSKSHLVRKVLGAGLMQSLGAHFDTGQAPVVLPASRPHMSQIERP